MTPSPKKIAVPKMPTSSAAGAAPGGRAPLRGQREHRDQAALPLLSARRISATYFGLTTTVGVQKIIDSTP